MSFLSPRWSLLPAAVCLGAALLGGVGWAAPLDLQVEHVTADAPLRLGAMDLRTRTEEEYAVTRASYLLSGFALRRPSGVWHELDQAVAWIDLSRDRTVAPLGDVPPGAYTQFRFALGLDAETNAVNPARIPSGHPLDPNLNGLHWSWQAGYIFLALEGSWRRSGEVSPLGFAYHVGGNANRTEIVLDAPLEVSADANTRLSIAFDLAKLLHGRRPISLARDGTSTHSQPGDPLAAALVANLPGAFSWRGTSTAPAKPESVAGGRALPPIRGTVSPGPVPWQAAFPQPAQVPQSSLPDPEAAITLGHRLFHEGALSRDGTVSCASCHPMSTAFADPRRYSLGVGGQPGERHAMPLFNLAWKREFFWDGRAPTLRAQVLVPIQDPREMDETLDNVVAKLGRSGYGGAFAEAFSTEGITPERIGLALESYLLTLTSHDSKFDRAMRGETKLTAQEERGFALFMTERDPRLGILGADCFHCHGGALFTDHQFRNNGLAISESDPGRFRVTGVGLDRGTFATPSLRNIALTAPYMHDGRFQTLEAVLDHYSEGVLRTETLDPNLAKHPDGGLHLTAQEKADVIAFLMTLSDPQFHPHASADLTPSRESPTGR